MAGRVLQTYTVWRLWNRTFYVFVVMFVEISMGTRNQQNTELCVHASMANYFDKLS